MITPTHTHTHERGKWVNGLREHLSRPPQPYKTPKKQREKVAPKREIDNTPEKAENKPKFCV